MLNIVVFIISE